MAMAIDLVGSESRVAGFASLEKRLDSRWAISWNRSWNARERDQLVTDTHLAMCDRLLKSPQLSLSAQDQERRYLKKFSAIHKPRIPLEELSERLSRLDQQIDSRILQVESSVERFCRKSWGEREAYLTALPENREKLSDAALIELLEQEAADLEEGLLDHLISGIDPKLSEKEQQRLYKSQRDQICDQIQTLRKRIAELKTAEARLTDDALKTSYQQANSFYGKYLESSHKKLQQRWEKHPVQLAVKGALVLGIAAYGVSNVMQYGLYKTISSACVWGLISSVTLQIVGALGLRSQGNAGPQIVS
jgi:hypothetical protein